MDCLLKEAQEKDSASLPEETTEAQKPLSELLAQGKQKEAKGKKGKK